MTYTVSSNDNIDLTLCETDTVKSVLQNLLIILNSCAGTIPQYRDFSMPMAYRDKPLTVARTILAVEIAEAIEKYEPRAEVKDVSISVGNDGVPIARIEVNITE